MTIRDLAFHHILQHSYTRQEALLILVEEFQQGGNHFDWDAPAPHLTQAQEQRIDRAAVGYRMRNGVPAPVVPIEPAIHDGRMLAAGKD